MLSAANFYLALSGLIEIFKTSLKPYCICIVLYQRISIKVEIDKICDAVEAETRKSQASFLIISSYATLAEHKT